MKTFQLTLRACMIIATLALGGSIVACGGDTTDPDERGGVEGTDTTEEALLPGPGGGGDCCSITCEKGSCSTCSANGRTPDCSCPGGSPVCEN
jgi:hypothetical protein